MANKKKKEPRQFYIMVDDASVEFRVDEDPELFEKEVAEYITDKEDYSDIRVFKGVELDLEVEMRPLVRISEKKEKL